jgi:molecular chaperone DnaK (HSP70)
MTLKTVKEEIFDFVKSRDGISLVANQVRWVVTLPAIWSEPAKQIMKQSARNAGLISDESSSNSRLLLALEPEAALMGISRGLSTLLPKMVGKTVMVADNGGGTVDICAVVSAVGLSVPKVQWNFFFFYSLICFRL